MRKSYRVTLSDGMSYKNDRDPHIETNQEIAPGSSFPLGIRRVMKMRNNYVVMYDVDGVQNGSHPAHVTVYFGPSEKEADAY